MKAVPEKNPAPDTARAATSRPEAAPVDRPAPDRPVPDRRSLQRLQGAAGNAAVARLVAQRYTAPVKPSPSQAAGFRKVKADVAAKRTRIAVHAPAATESKSAQDAAVAPPDDKEAQGKAANAEKMNAAKPGEFNKQAFIDAVNKAIEAQAPKNLDDADKFSESGKADKIKSEVDGKVTDGKEKSAKDIETTTKAAPDTSAAKDKQVTPMTPDQPPANPGAPSAADAIPAQQPAAVTDFSEGPAQNDKAMADAEVTEDQLAKGNETEFNEALSAKKTAETDSAKAPAKGKAAEAQQLSSAKTAAAASGTQAMNALTATRAAAGKEVDGGKGDTKSKDEKKRAEVTAKLQKVYDSTKKDVEETLSGLDKKVDDKFTSGEKAARDAFTADHKRRMKAYKDKRYSGWTGKARWVKDKFAGLPQEANNLYQEARKLYVAQMQTVISSVADIIGTELGKAKARIAKGRGELKAEVDKLPADLRQFGEDAAKDFAGKFDDLEATVNEKSEQLVQDLATKYTAALNKIDEEIKKLQEANKGLIDKAKDAIVGAIKTINELKNLLLGILAKAASAIMKIIKDPIGFLGNLVKAVGAGLQLFITNIADHLKKGVVSWLLGTAVKAGLDLPQKFDLKGIIQIIGSLLGLTWANIRARVTRKGVPEQAMSAVEQSVPVAQTLAREGPAGAVKEITEEAGDLKATILEKLTSYLIPTVIIAGITWIISLLNPASAFVRAVKGIIDIVTFIVNQGAQIVEFVNAVLDAVIAIANGGSAGVPKMVEAALAASVPLLIGFLASLLGIGGLANKVKSVFHAVARPVNRAIDKIVGFIVKAGKKLWTKLKTANKPGKRNQPGKSKNKSDINKVSTEAQKHIGRLGRGPLEEKEVTRALDPVRNKYQEATITPHADSTNWSIHVQLASIQRPTKSLDLKGAYNEIYRGLRSVESRAMLNIWRSKGGATYAEWLKMLIPMSKDKRERALRNGYAEYTGTSKYGTQVDHLRRKHQKCETVLIHGINEESKRSSDQACTYMRGELQAIKNELDRIGNRLADKSGWTEREEKEVEYDLNEITEKIFKAAKSHGYEAGELIRHPSKYAVDGRLKNDYAKDIRGEFYPGDFTAQTKRDIRSRDLQNLIDAKGEHEDLKDQVGARSKDYFYCHWKHHFAHVSEVSLDHQTPVARHWNDGHSGSIGNNTHQQKRRDWYNLQGNLEILCGPCNSSKQSGGVNYKPEVGPLFKGPDDP
ncbi:HPC2 multi-domain protein [Streptomyces sp. NPDC057486]|uniref:HPC2 multi-domain protein n=1 Tax=Streptomyces sp. NPDC057486 TaxID=3346145 RepID=UPI00368FD92F